MWQDAGAPSPCDGNVADPLKYICLSPTCITMSYSVILGQTVRA